MEKAIEFLKNKTALVISGGGVLGVSEVGSLRRLHELNALGEIESVTGSSVGSIIATAIACGAPIDYMEKTMFEMNLPKFKDNDCFIKDIFQLLKKWGLNKTKEIKKLAEKVLSDFAHKDVTFEELYISTGIHLTITVLSMNYEKTLYYDYINTPKEKISDTIVKSSSIPLFYEAIFEGKGKGKQSYVDGATVNSYPMNVPKKQGYSLDNILGLKLISEEDINHIDNGGDEFNDVNKGPPKNIIQHIIRLITILRDQALRLHVHKDDWKHSIKINVGKMTSTDFDMTEEDKQWLFNQGKKAVDEYVDYLINEHEY